MAGKRFASLQDRGVAGPASQAGAGAASPVAQGKTGGVAVSKQGVIHDLAARIARIEGRAPEFTQAIGQGVNPAAGTAPDKPADSLQSLRASMASGVAGGGGRRVLLGVADIDARLGGGLAGQALHEVRTETTLALPAGGGFALALAGLLTGFSQPVFWISMAFSRREAGAFYGPGIAGLGLDPGLVVRVFVRDVAEAMWAAGEICATPSAGLCLLELRGNPAIADLAFSRRLLLRAQASGVPVILLRQAGGAEASAAVTRWHIHPIVSPKEASGQAERWLGRPAWHAVLEKCRGGRTGSWNLEWKKDECQFALCHDAAATARRNPQHRRADDPAISGDQPAAAGHGPDRPAAMGRAVAFERAS